MWDEAAIVDAPRAADLSARAGQPLRVLVATPHPLVRAALISILQGLRLDARCDEAEGLADGVSRLAADGPYALAVLDADAGGLSAEDELPAVRGARLVLLTSDRRVVCGRSGTACVIRKDQDVDSIRSALGAALRAAAPRRNAVRDAPPLLTSGQRRVLDLLRQGRLNKQIAFELGVSEATVKAHMTAIFRKLGVANRTQAILAADRLAWS